MRWIIRLIISILTICVIATLAFLFFIKKFISEGKEEIFVSIKTIDRMPDIPSPFKMKNWKAIAVAYDKFVFNFSQKGKYLPLIALDKKYDSFILPSYVGQPLREGGGEAINLMAAVLGATLVGINKSSQNGLNYISMLKAYYNPKIGIFLNERGGWGHKSFWYDIYPNILMFSLLYYYPREFQVMRNELYTTADTWYKVVMILKENNNINFDHTAFDFEKMDPYDNGVWIEPDAAAGVAWIMYVAYKIWGEERFLNATKLCLNTLQNRETNPFYENLLPYAAYVAARMNAELNTTYDVKKFIEWCFDASSIVRPGWGVITGNWGGYDVNGLVGSTIDGGGYAFTMNTFAMAAPLVPLVRYDPRFAKPIGKWMLNVANNARLFYPDALPQDYQSSAFWKGDPNHIIAYEGLRREWKGKSPYATGDALRNGWAPTDLGLYGSSHVGIFGGIIDFTNDDKILRIDLLKTDFYHDPAYPTYLYYNPYTMEKFVKITVGSEPKDINDLVLHDFLVKNASGTVEIKIPAKSAIVIVLVPSGGSIKYFGKKMIINNIVVDYNYKK